MQQACMDPAEIFGGGEGECAPPETMRDSKYQCLATVTCATITIIIN